MALTLNAQKSAVLVIDRAVAVIEKLAAALSRLRKSGAKIIHNRIALRPDYSDAGILERAFPRLKELGHCVKGTWDFENVRGFQPGPNEYVIDKIRFDGFHGTELESLLRCIGQFRFRFR